MLLTDNDHEISADAASWCELATVGEIYEFREGEIMEIDQPIETQFEGEIDMKRNYYWCLTYRYVWIIKYYTEEEAKLYRERCYYDVKLIGQ